MVASKKTIGKLGMYIPKTSEVVEGIVIGDVDIRKDYIIILPKRSKLTKIQKKHKARKFAHKTRMYNYLHQ